MKQIKGTAKISNRGGSNHLKHIYFKTESNFFDQPLKFTIEEEYLILNPACLDDIKNVIEPKKAKGKNYYDSSISFLKCDTIPENGIKHFDEESNEDEVIIKL